MRRARLALLLPLLVAGCGGGEEPGGSACTIRYTGGADETAWCEATLRANGSGGYVLWVMAFRGSALGGSQAGQVTVTFTGRPVKDVAYGWTGATVGALVNGANAFENRTDAGGNETHLALAGTNGAFSVTFTSIPASDGPDPTGIDGIGPVHGTFTATLPPTGAGSDVAVAGSF